MRFLTSSESAEWCQTHGFGLDAQDLPGEPEAGLHRVRADIPKSIDQLAWFCRLVEETLQPRRHCLLRMTAWGIWESGENWHLYYRLRQGYGDSRLLEEAPGHLFLDFERPDLVSFIQIGTTSGWDMDLLPSSGYARAFISHDGWVEFAMRDQGAANKIKQELN